MGGVRDLVGVPEAPPAYYRAQADLLEFRQRSRGRNRRRQYGWSFLLLFVLATLLFCRAVLPHTSLARCLGPGLRMPAELAFLAKLSPAFPLVLVLVALGLSRVRRRETEKEAEAEQCWLLLQELSCGRRERPPLSTTLCMADWHGRLRQTTRSWAESLEWELARTDEKRTAQLYRCFWCYFVVFGLWMKWLFYAPHYVLIGNLG